MRGRSDTSSSSELREDDTTSSSESAGTVKGAPDRGRVIQHMDALRAKLMQALTKRAKMNPLNVPGLLYHCHARCLPAMSSTLMRVALCKVGWPRPTSVPCRGRRVCPEYLVCCSRPWSAISIIDHTQDRSDGYPALRATDQAETSRQLDGNGYRTRAQVAFGHRQLRVLLVSSHACHGWSYRDACRLYESKRPALLCAAIAITLLCYAVLIVHRSDCSEMLRSPTLNTTERRAELGPKSQHRDCKHRYLLFALLLLLNHTTLAEGAGTDPGKPRVVIGPATMTGASTGIHTSRAKDEAKTCGEGPKQPSPNIRKIAFRKATARAHSAGLAQYRGRTLRAAPRSEPSSQQGTVPTLSRSRNPPHSLVKAGRITIMSYNAGGLSTHHYTELLAWLHIQRRQRQGPDVVMVQETHWLGEQDYSNDEWHVLSSGCDRRHSGLLIMLAKTKFPCATIRKEIAVAGRLLSARIQQGPKVIHLMNVYQKVWNGTPEAKQLRAQVLDALQQQLQQAPSRYPLIIAGDFNASLEHKPPFTGSAVTSTAYAAGVPDLDRLHGLLKQFDLRALNTFCPQSEKHTFTMYDSRKSQIDYVIVRARSADSTAKAPRVLHQTQLAQWKMGSVHHPVMASIPTRFWHHPHQVAAKDGDRAQALRRGLSPNADKSGFLEAVATALRDMQTWDTTAVNAVLTTAAEQYLVPNCPRRSSKPVAAEQPVKHMWEQYRLLKEAQRVGAASEDLKTRQDAFKQAQKVVRGFSKQRRATFLDEQLKQAAAASEKGDIRTLHTIINRIAPRTSRARPQIRNTDGKMVSPACELRIIKNFWQDLYTARLPVVLGEPGTIALDADSFAHALARLPTHKSLPKHYVPSIAWKIAARPIADLLQRTVFDAWQHDSINVPQAWRDAWLALILKPSQPGKHPSQYRPIGLTDPIGKTVLGMVREQHESEIYAAALSLPQYAFIRHRGTAQALAKAFQHAYNARTLLAEQKITLSNRKAGAKPSQLVGAVTVSIDLTKAFDSLEPAIMQRALDHSALPHAVKQLILQWHQGLHYHLQHEQYSDSIHCQRGIRQGCRIAPSVWALFTALAMHDIDVEWCKQNSTWYADDTLFQAVFHGERQLQSTLAAIAKALHVLQTLGMTISASKCAVMIELRGTKAKRTKARIVTQHQKRPHLIVEHEGTQWRLPIVTKLDYLGAVLSYHRPEDATTDKRLQASRTAFERMKPVLSNRNLPLQLRIRLWRTCVVSSMLYGLPQVGLTKQGATRLSVQFHRQLRHITCTPVHISLASNAYLRQQRELNHPIDDVAVRAAGQVQATDCLALTLHPQDARLDPAIVQAERRVAQALQALTQAKDEGTVVDARPILTCQDCGFRARGRHILARHCVRQHGRSKRPLNYQSWKQVSRLDHARGGLPVCRWCQHDFGAWQNLQRHIYWTRCHEKQLGPGQHAGNGLPPIAEQDVLQLQDAPAIPVLPETQRDRPQQERPVAQRLPLSTYDQAPMAILAREAWLRDELREHCCFCRQWTIRRGGTKIHLQALHQHEWGQTAELARAKCLQYHHHVSPDTGCRFCLEPKFADKRAAMAHAQNCQVLFQIMMLTVMREEEIGLPAGLSPAVVQLPGGQTVQLQAAPDSLSLTPEQRQYLAKHCVVCKQYMPDPTSLKQHIRRKHPHIQIEQAAIQSRCRQLIRVEQGKCLFCDKGIKKARDHAPSCLVVFQACLSRHLIDHVGTTGGIRPPVPGLEQMDQSSNPNKRPKPDPETQPLPKPKGRGKGKAGKGKSKARAGGWSSSWDTQSTDLDNTVYALARLCLRQEEELTELRQEKGFLLHMTTSQYGILKPLVQSSIEWNSMRDAGKVTCNLRTCLFRLMLQELTARLRKLQESPQSISEATKALWAH